MQLRHNRDTRARGPQKRTWTKTRPAESRSAPLISLAHVPLLCPGKTALRRIRTEETPRNANETRGPRALTRAQPFGRGGGCTRLGIARSPSGPRGGRDRVPPLRRRPRHTVRTRGPRLLQRKRGDPGGEGGRAVTRRSEHWLRFILRLHGSRASDLSV